MNSRVGNTNLSRTTSNDNDNVIMLRLGDLKKKTFYYLSTGAIMSKIRQYDDEVNKLS